MGLSFAIKRLRSVTDQLMNVTKMVTFIVTKNVTMVTMLKKTNGETLTFRHATDCKYPLSNTPLQR